MPHASPVTDPGFRLAFVSNLPSGPIYSGVKIVCYNAANGEVPRGGEREEYPFSPGGDDDEDDEDRKAFQ